MSKEYDIFISYSRLDINRAQIIKKELEEKSKVACWMDLDGIESASQFEEVIIKAIDNSKAVIFLLSEHSMDSEYAKKEVRYANETHKRLIPVKIDSSSPKGWFLFSFSGIDVIDYNDAFQKAKLIRDLQVWFSQRVNVLPSRLVNEHECAEIHIETDMDCHVQRFHKDMIVAKVEEENVIHLAKGKHKLQFIAVGNPEIKDSCEYKVEDVTESDYIEVFLKEKAGIISVEARELESLKHERDELQKQMSETISALQSELVRKDERIKNLLTRFDESQEALKQAKEEAERRAREERERNVCEAEAQRKVAENEKQSRIIKLGDVEFKMIHVEGGTFTMGSRSEQMGVHADEKPAHPVTLSNYCIGETPVTQALWTAVMGSNPSRFKGDNNPVESVSWNDCQDFIKELNARTGKNFRLPTEAEWEFAARGGSMSKCTQYGGSDNLKKVAWYNNNSCGKTNPVKTKNHNELNIYDMSGNVWEWCQDWYGNYRIDEYFNPTGPSTGLCRVNRGGSWSSDASHCRLTYRNYGTPEYGHNYIGLRLALSE